MLYFLFNANGLFVNKTFKFGNVLEAFIESNENVTKVHKSLQPRLLVLLLALILLALISFFVFFLLNYNFSFKENLFHTFNSVKKSLACMKKKCWFS